jgi:hypothetical protein
MMDKASHPGKAVRTGQQPAASDKAKSPHPKSPEKKKKLDDELDKALMDSFPASDPVAPAQPTSNRPAGDPKTKP